MPEAYQKGERGHSRAKRGKEDPKSPLMVWVDTRTLNQFSEAAHNQGVSMSEVVRKAIEEFLGRKR